MSPPHRHTTPGLASYPVSSRRRPFFFQVYHSDLLLRVILTGQASRVWALVDTSRGAGAGVRGHKDGGRDTSTRLQISHHRHNLLPLTSLSTRASSQLFRFIISTWHLSSLVLRPLLSHGVPSVTTLTAPLVYPLQCTSRFRRLRSVLSGIITSAYPNVRSNTDARGDLALKSIRCIA